MQKNLPFLANGRSNYTYNQHETGLSIDGNGIVNPMQKVPIFNSHQQVFD